MISRFHVLRIVIFHLGSAALRLGNADADMVCGHLQKIPVTRHERDFHPFPLRTLRDGSKNVVRLQPRLFHHADAHGQKQLLHHRHLFPKLRGHGLSRALVLLVYLMPEGGRVDIESHRQIIRLLLLQNLEHNIQKAEDRVRVEPLPVGQFRHPVKRPVQYTVSVYQNQFQSHILSSLTLPFLISSHINQHVTALL